jgi:S-adenosylmethionine-diacylgycerolhomoserine-N-methlytransferase
MSRYYRVHAGIYDATRWMFLFGRRQIVSDLALRDGDTVLEVGCGTGTNFFSILERIGTSGRIIGVDCSAPMLAKARRRIQGHGWSNIELVDAEFGIEPIHITSPDVILFSYSLSMIPRWNSAVAAAHELLKPGGRIAIIDFGLARDAFWPRLFSSWLRFNHVCVERQYRSVLSKYFDSRLYRTDPGTMRLWTYFSFIGSRNQAQGNELG